MKDQLHQDGKYPNKKKFTNPFVPKEQRDLPNNTFWMNKSERIDSR